MEIKQNARFDYSFANDRLRILHVFSEYVVYENWSGDENTINRDAFENWVKNGFLKEAYYD